MKFLLLPLSIVTLQAGEAWNSKLLTSDFYSEGAAIGDLNCDGNPDVVYGPLYSPGPDFTELKRYTPGEKFNPLTGYSDNFFTHVHDINSDGKDDVVIFGFPGKEVRLYLNPGEESEEWPMVEIAHEVGNEAPDLVELVDGGLPEIVASRGTEYGYFQAGDDPTKEWEWVPVSAKLEAPKPYGHGYGVGDLNGDGRLDIIEKKFWYEQPEKTGTGLWKKHDWAGDQGGSGGAQIRIEDFDGDGDSDIVTSLVAHGYGIAWFEQTEKLSFKRHLIVGNRSIDNPFGVVFSQPHGLETSDIDGDGRMDFVCGKRWMAHQGRDIDPHQAQVLYWFRNTVNEGKVEFVPHLIHDSHGLGVSVEVGDLNGDGTPDIVAGNKRGVHIHLQSDLSLSQKAERWQVPGGRPETDFGNGLSPQEAAAKFEVPEGFDVDLVLSEPDLVQPIAMCFDARGRLWIIEGHTYPQRREEGQGKDRVLIFEDADQDGSFESKKVFAENINLASGIEVGFGGVYIGAAPYLLFYPDENGDDKPDSEPQVLLDGWGWQDTHETLNSFTWGPDGWLYGCHGVFTHSNVGKPGAPDAERQKINAGVWRYHPTKHEFEIFAHGTSNPWGLDFDQSGELFITACVIPHLFHLSQGGRYIRQAGSHFNPHTYVEIDTIADHPHFEGKNPWGHQHPNTQEFTKALGGGHAHCGLCIYQADQFPENYRNEMLFSNLHGHRIVREHLESDGSGFVGRHRPDFALAKDHQFTGVTVIQGPDGALYVSDWHDSQTCHHHDVNIWDRSNGRVYRIRHGEKTSPSINLPDLSNEELVARLADQNVFYSRQAQRLLQERSNADGFDSQALGNLLVSFVRTNEEFRLRALWTAHACNLLSEEFLLGALVDEDESIRKWVVQFLGEDRQLSPKALTALTEHARKESSFVVRRYLTSLLQRLPLDQRWDLATELISRSHEESDRNLKQLAWYAIEPLVAKNPGKALNAFAGSPWRSTKDLIVRRAAGLPEGRSAFMASLIKAPNERAFQDRANRLLGSLRSMPPVEQPKGWAAARKRGEELMGENRDLIKRLGVRFGDPDFFPAWREVVANNSQTHPIQKRMEALNLLKAGRDPGLGNVARTILAEKEFQEQAIEILRAHPGAETANLLINKLPDLPLGLRNNAINLLASQPEMARALLMAVDQKTLQSSLISPVLLDQFALFKDKEIDTLISRNWIRGGGELKGEELKKAMNKWRDRLKPEMIAKADSAAGKKVFSITCGTCHQLKGEGIALGPDLTGSNRASLDYLLENVLNPSATVGLAYQLNNIRLADGGAVSGIVIEEGEKTLTIALAGGSRVEVERSQIKDREVLPISLMPAGLFDALEENQVRDLVKYLQE